MQKGEKQRKREGEKGSLHHLILTESSLPSSIKKGERRGEHLPQT